MLEKGVRQEGIHEERIQKERVWSLRDIQENLKDVLNVIGNLLENLVKEKVKGKKNVVGLRENLLVDEGIGRIVRG